MINVFNEGEQIAENQLEHIWESFYTLSRKNKGGDTQKMNVGLGLYMVKKEDDIAYEIEIERSEEMEQEIDNSINQMNDEFRMTRTAAELTDLQGKEE